MDQVRSSQSAQDLQVRPEGLHGRICGLKFRRHCLALYFGSVEILGARSPETMHMEIYFSGQDPAELGDVNACSSVDFRREFLRHNIYSH